MSFRIAESYHGDRADTATLEGRTIPVPSIVEDDHGIRVLVVDSPSVPSAVWVWAVSATAEVLLDLSLERFVTIEDFTDHRTEAHSTRTYELADRYWEPYTPGMTSMDMLTAHDGPVVALCSDLGTRPTGFVHLHTHTEGSPQDGLTTVAELVDVVTEHGDPAVAVADHGTCAMHPELQIECDRKGIKPIFGIEAYFVDDATVHEDLSYYHLTLWAMDDEGLRNLWAMSTASYEPKNFYGKPRMDWSILQRHAAGVLVSTGCEHGPLAVPYLAGNEELALANLAKLRAIFGDRLYVELHTNGRDESETMNTWLVDVATTHALPMIAVVDSHYAHAHQKEDHQVWVRSSTGKDIEDEAAMFSGGHDYHLMTRDEVVAALSYLDPEVVEEACANTVRLAARCTARMQAKGHNPVYSRATAEHPDPVAHDVQRLLAMCLDNWKARTAGKRYSQAEYMARFEREMKLLIEKGFCGYFLLVADVVAWAKKIGILVGPGRGSGGGSLVGYLSMITEVDPVENDLLFERFMTEGRKALPDFDIDFPSSKNKPLLDYLRERWGADHIAIVGTHMRLQNKSVVRAVFKVLAPTLPEGWYVHVDEVCEIIDAAEAGTAGLGLSWEELWAQEGDLLEGYRLKYPQCFALCTSLVGRLKSYGKHPAGVIIDTDSPITSSLPLRRGEDNAPMVCQFDLGPLEELGYVKLDLLKLRNLDTLQQTVDMIESMTGRWIDLYHWRPDEEWSDPMVYDMLGEGRTLGLFQIEKSLGTQMTLRLQPRTVAELADVITLGRPGPMRSGLTDTYFRRRNGEEEVTYPDPRLESVLAKTYGCMLYQEDIMAVCITLAGYASDEADVVRKVLGKKQVEKAKIEGEKFIRRAVENGTDQQVAEDLWFQMEEFAKYSFNRAHAFAYAIIVFWTSWLKVHYTVQLMCALLSTVKKERIPEFVEEARAMGYAVQPPDINLSGTGFSCTNTAVRYGLDAISGLGDVAVDAIKAGQPYASWDDFLERKTSKCNSGHVEKLVAVGAFDSLGTHRRALERVLEHEVFVSKSDSCVWRSEHDRKVWVGWPTKKAEKAGEEPQERFLPCGYDWATEPQEKGRSGKLEPRKPPPKACTRGCRHFTAPAAPTVVEVEPYTDADIRRIEMELLGVFLSSTPFDRVKEFHDELSTAEQVRSGGSGLYQCDIWLRSIRVITEKINKQREMAFLTCSTRQGAMDVTLFHDNFVRYYDDLFDENGKFFQQLALAQVKKTKRGLNIESLRVLG